YQRATNATVDALVWADVNSLDSRSPLSPAIELIGDARSSSEVFEPLFPLTETLSNVEFRLRVQSHIATQYAYRMNYELAVEIIEKHLPEIASLAEDEAKAFALMGSLQAINALRSMPFSQKSNFPELLEDILTIGVEIEESDPRREVITGVARSYFHLRRKKRAAEICQQYPCGNYRTHY
ncbi:MAG: hypothetical protein AAFX40_06495, partial [Cyanobacteria bacterium J06639_1]